MTNNAHGREKLYGVGVGPGDPELITMKAQRLIGEARVLAYPTDKAGNSRAYNIAKAFVRPETELLGFYLPMVPDPQPAQKAYDRVASDISIALNAGKSVVYLCEGDPLFYGSFSYVHTRLKEDHAIEIVPGVSSLTACSAAAGVPLAGRNDILKVVPATLSKRELKTTLSEEQSVVLIKIGRHFKKVLKVIEELDLSQQAFLVQDATTSGERLQNLACSSLSTPSYFSSIVIYRGKNSWNHGPQFSS